MPHDVVVRTKVITNGRNYHTFLHILNTEDKDDNDDVRGGGDYNDRQGQGGECILFGSCL